MQNIQNTGKRWYDRDPALSMAISLLNNASYEQQRLTAEYILSQVDHLIDDDTGCESVQAKQFLQVAHLFPSLRRLSMDPVANRMVEILKNLPNDVQLEMALNIINQIYMLEASVTLPPSQTANRALLQRSAQSKVTS